MNDAEAAGARYRKSHTDLFSNSVFDAYIEFYVLLVINFHCVLIFISVYFCNDFHNKIK